MTRPVFLAPPEILEEALPGQRLVLEGDEARHALQVRRLHAGEEIDLVDGAGRRVSGPITETSGSGATSRLSMTVTTVTQEPAPRPRLVLAQALAKGGRDEQRSEERRVGKVRRARGGVIKCAGRRTMVTVESHIT